MSINFSNVKTTQPPQNKYQTYPKKKIPNETFDERLQRFRDDIEADRVTVKEENVIVSQKSNTAATFALSQSLFTQWDSSLPAEEQLQKLDSNLSKIADYSFSSSVDVEEVLEHLASQYSVFKKQLTDAGSTEHLETLDAIMQKNVDSYAKGFSEQVGGFFEKNGMPGEQERMYQVIGEHVKLLSDAYDGFLAADNKLFDGLIKRSNEKNLSISSELRRLYQKDGGGESIGAGIAYTVDTLSSAAQLAKDAQKILSDGDFGAVSEEELGVRLGEIAVIGLDNIEKSEAPPQFKNAFYTAIRSHIDTEIEKSDQLLKEKSSRTSDQRRYTPLDRSAVDAVIQSVIDSYNHSGSVKDAVSVGKEFGMHLFFGKKASQDGVARYEKSDFFDEKRSEMLHANSGDSAQIRRAAFASMADYQNRLEKQKGLNLYA